jgi:outer membrane biogenesis lipoprotein LolB
MRTTLAVPLLILVALVLGACASTPPADTLHKQAAVFEVSYRNVLEKATLWREEGRLSETAVQRLGETFDRIDQARRVMYAALDAGNLSEAESQLDVARESLAIARDILIELERREE